MVRNANINHNSKRPCCNGEDGNVKMLPIKKGILKNTLKYKNKKKE